MKIIQKRMIMMNIQIKYIKMCNEIKMYNYCTFLYIIHKELNISH